MDYQIIVDETADFTPEMWEKLRTNVTIVPMHLEPAELEEMDIDKFYDYLYYHGQYAQVKTSSTTLQEARNAVEQACLAGKDVIYLSMAQSLSKGSYQTASFVAREMRQRYPQRRIAFFDSTCASGGLGLLVERIVDMALPYEEALYFIQTYAKDIIHVFCVDNFGNLIRGGRFKAASQTLTVRLLSLPLIRKIISFLGLFIKVIIGFYLKDQQKTMLPLRIKIGQQRLIQGFIYEVQRYLPTHNYYHSPDIIIAYAGDEQLARKIYDALCEQNPNLRDRIRMGRIGKVMGTHCGETATALFFWGEAPLRK